MTCAVLLNLDGTLTDNNVDFEDVYYDALDRAGITALEDTYEDYTDRFFNYFQAGWAFPRRQAVLDLLNDHRIDDLGLSDAFGEAWEELETDHTIFRPDAASTVKELAETYAVGVVTMGTSRLQRMKLEKAGITDHVDAVMISTEIGKNKPNAEFFEEAKNAITADTYVMVSHDLRRDILPAKRLDMKTVWIGSSDAENNPKLQQLVDAQIAGLSELPEAVDDLCE